MEELTSQLKKVERVETQAREKEQKNKAKRYSQRITSGRFLKQAKAVTLVQTKKQEKVDENGRHSKCRRRRRTQTTFQRAIIFKRKVLIALT